MIMLVREFLKTTSTTGLEVQNSTLSIVAGLVFFCNGSRLYDRFPDTYRNIEFAPAEMWGAVYFAAGVMHLLCLYTGLKYLRKQVLIIKAGLWVFLGVCVMLSDRYTLAGYVFLILATAAFFSFLRIKILRTEVYAANA